MKVWHSVQFTYISNHHKLYLLNSENSSLSWLDELWLKVFEQSLHYSPSWPKRAELSLLIYELSELKLRISLEVILIVFFRGTSTFLSFFINFSRIFICFSCLFRPFYKSLLFLSLSIKNLILLSTYFEFGITDFSYWLFPIWLNGWGEHLSPFDNRTILILPGTLDST